MSRYLTAAKVAYLALVHLYCDDAIPSSAVVDFLSMTVSLTSKTLEIKDDGSGQSMPEPLVISSVEDLEQQPALKRPSTVPGRSIYEMFVKKLWEIDSLDALHDTIDASDALFEPPPQDAGDAEASFTPTSPTRTVVLGQRSPLGAFVRRIMLEFTRLQFGNTIRLWLAFIKFRAPSQSVWERQISETPSFDRVLRDLKIEPDSGLATRAYRVVEKERDMQPVASINDVERLLDFQVAKMQRFGGRVPPEVLVQLREMVSKLRWTPGLSYFISFFDAWRAGDYHTSFDRLHRYFDHTMRTHDKSRYQYALLHMAILHADFGCFSEAVASMNEAVTTARENQDFACLNFSLNWINHLRKAHPKEMKRLGWPGALGESERDTLAFLKSKSRDMKMWSLFSSALLSEARLDLTSGEGMTRALEHIYQSSHVLITHNIQHEAGPQLSLQSALYARLGCLPLAVAYNDLVDECYAHLVPQDDLVRASCRRAFMLASEGSYNEAVAILKALQGPPRKSRRTQQLIATRLHMLSLARCIRRSDALGTQRAIASLTPLASADAELAFEFQVLCHRHASAQGNTPRASAILRTLASATRAPDAADVHSSLTTALLKVRAYAHAGVPQRGLTLALRVAGVAMRAGLAPLLWDAVALLAAALVELQEYEAARALLDAVIPVAHEGGDAELLGALYAGLADACVGLLLAQMGAGDVEEGEDPDPDQDQDQEQEQQRGEGWPGVERTELFLHRAEEYYRMTENRDEIIAVMAKKALLAQMRGDGELANGLAEKVEDFEMDAG